MKRWKPLINSRVISQLIERIVSKKRQTKNKVFYIWCVSLSCESVQDKTIININKSLFTSLAAKATELYNKNIMVDNKFINVY